MDLISLLYAEFGLLYPADELSASLHCGTIKLGPKLYSVY